jgi:hypothetical protein
MDAVDELLRTERMVLYCLMMLCRDHGIDLPFSFPMTTSQAPPPEDNS